jgi:hypothetical protein
MKRTLLVLGFFTASISMAQDCSELFISEYVEGSGNDKAIELYNPTGMPISLAGYRIERYSNGSSTSTAGGVLQLSGTIAPHSAFVIANGQTNSTTSSPACSPALQALADQLDGVYPAPTYMNGNDAIGLLKNGVKIDIFGKIGDATMVTADGWSDAFPYDGSAGTVWTENHTLVRKSSVKKGVTVNPDPFIVTAEWDSLPQNTWSGLGQHVCDCPLGLNEMNTTISFVVYPNPSQAGLINVSSSEMIASIEVVDVLGRTKNRENLSELVTETVLDGSALEKGMYVIRLTYANGQFSQTNLIIQ